MKEYIEREAAIKAIENDCLELVYYTKEDAIQCVKAIPAADVVEVVRCKDCKHSGMYCFGNSKEETLACLETEEDGFVRFATAVKADDYCSAYKAYKCLMNDGHSGMSIGFTKNILNRLIDGKPLTPIEDTPEVWGMPSDYDDKISYQCNRMYSLFKDVYPDGRVLYHDTGRVLCVYKDNPSIPWYNGFISRIIHEKYPITMPYSPAANPFVVYCTEGLSDPDNGDFDTIGVWYVVKPDREKDTIERFFKESPDGREEISKQEYFERVGENHG